MFVILVNETVEQPYGAQDVRSVVGPFETEREAVDALYLSGWYLHLGSYTITTNEKGLTVKGVEGFWEHSDPSLNEWDCEIWEIEKPATGLVCDAN